MKRVLLVVTVALVMVAMVLVTAMPVFAQKQEPPSTPPGYGQREDDKERPPQTKYPFTGPPEHANPSWEGGG